MSDRIRIEVSGNAQVARAFGRLEDDTSDLSDPMGAVGARVVAQAQANARRQTGALASSVHLERRPLSASIVSGLAYSGVQNYGWRRRNITPTYFMNLAADTQGELAADLVAAEISANVRKAGLA